MVYGIIISVRLKLLQEKHSLRIGSWTKIPELQYRRKTNSKVYSLTFEKFYPLKKLEKKIFDCLKKKEVHTTDT